MKKATSKKSATSKKNAKAAPVLLGAVKVDGACITESDGTVSFRKAPWNETEVISEKPQIIRGRLVCSGAENGRGDWLDFLPYIQGNRDKPFTEILKTKHGVVRTSKRTVQVNYTFSKDMSKADVLRCLKGEHLEVVKAIKPFKENVDWEAYRE